MQTVGAGLRNAARVIALGLLGWLALATATWLRYGHARPRAHDGEDRLDAFIPDPEVDESHQTRVRAGPETALEMAKALDLQRSPLVWLIFTLRTLPGRLRGESVRWESPGLVEETRGIGWGVLADEPGQLYIAGAVAQPWQADVEFRALPPEDFEAFDEPGYAKIVWTLEADEVPGEGSTVRSRTRVKTTDSTSRRLFRRYWAVFSPGILLIRYEALRLLRREADRLASTQPPRR